MPTPKLKKTMINTKLIALAGGALLGAILMYAELSPIAESYAIDLPYCDTPAAAPALLATAAFAYDAATGQILFDKNSDAQLPLASLTKVMTVVTALETLSPTATVTITADALTPEGEYGLKVGEKWEAQDLADFTLLGSSNDGARALMLASGDGSDAHFYEAMNRYARALGLQETYFVNETGLDVSATTAGAYGSARDVARLLAHAALAHPALVQGSVFAEKTFVTASGVHKVTNTSLLASTLMAPLASKTGYTDLAGGNLALVFEPILGHPVAVAVLGSSREQRDADARAVAVYSKAALRKALVCAGN